MTSEQQKQLLLKKVMIKKELVKREAASSFEKFLIYLNPDFYIPRLKIKEYKEAVEALQLMAEGYLELIVLQFPAGFGKSYLRECFNAWMIGNDRNNTALIGTYSGTIAKSFSSYFKTITKQKEYKDIFGHLQLQIDTANEVRVKGTTLPYTHFTRGAGASTTGTRARFIQIDDIIKDFEESQSELIKEKRWNWYSTTLKTRKADATLKEIWVGTRWSKDDPMGLKLDEVEKQIESGLVKPYKVKIIAVPAMKTITLENGKKKEVSICEDWTTTEEIKKIKLELSNRPEIWEALYQQNPIDSLSSLFPEKAIQTFETKKYMQVLNDEYGFEINSRLLNQNEYTIFTQADHAGDGDDYHAVLIIGYHSTLKEFHLLDVVFTNAGYDVAYKEHTRKILKYKPIQNYFENNNGGKLYKKDVMNEVRNRVNTAYIGKTTTQNKQNKIYIWSSFALQIIKFRSDWKTMPESHPYRQFMNQLLSYSRDGKSKHDDAPDVLAMASITISKQFGITNSTIKTLKMENRNK